MGEKSKRIMVRFVVSKKGKDPQDKIPLLKLVHCKEKY
jgi:hypothetical protein